MLNYSSDTPPRVYIQFIVMETTRTPALELQERREDRPVRTSGWRRCLPASAFLELLPGEGGAFPHKSESQSEVPHFISLHKHCTSRHFTAPEYTALHYTAQHSTMLHYISLHYITLHQAGLKKKSASDRGFSEDFGLKTRISKFRD